MSEQTFIMVKPDGVRRHLVGGILQRFEQRGFDMMAAKLFRMSREQAEFHYESHKGKPFFEELVEFITSGPVFGMVWQGENVIELSRMMMGKTNPLDAQPGTIRGDYATYVGENIIHGSDSLESAKREINNFFTKEELEAQWPPR
ncbi:nucleoside-diphosphate kinase [Paenibacillus sp. YYML68]|uniref:nucleoside-diphosphate kinase n=1 Tax=Paenibacillus sp. YYML68 TaxID=2909250 RepID=UPI0024917F87|nr:nucleoside-diphosphate kinase [Paenibacillus sp. YYML68]